jgi:hypothetical protein
MTRMAFQWVYANGSCWVPLDMAAQSDIEELWSRNAANWINSTTFPSAVYVNISEMILIHNIDAYTIARKTH